MSALEAARDGAARAPRARSRRSSSGQVGDALVGAHAPRSLRNRPRRPLASAAWNARGARLLRADRGVGLAAAPLAALVLGRLPGRGPGLRQGARPAARRPGWCGWPALGSRPYGYGTIVGASSSRARRARPGGCAARAARCAGETPRRLAAAPRDWPRRRCRPRTRCGCGCGPARRPCSRSRSRRWRCSSPTRPTSGAPRSRWTWRSLNAANRVELVPAARPVDGGRGRSTTTTSATSRWRCRRQAARARRPTTATTSRVARAVRAVGDGGVHARRDAVGGGAAAAAGARRAGRRSAWRRSRCASCSATSRARASGCAADGPPGDYDWFAASRVIPDTINEFPWFSFLLGDLHAHVLALPFTLLALAFALQVALAGPRGDRAGARSPRRSPPGSRSARCTPINSWSYPVAAGLLVLRGRRSGCAARERTGGARSAPSGWCSCCVAERRARAAVLAELRPGRARDRAGRRAALVRALRGRPGAALRRASRGCWSRPPSPAGCSASRRPLRTLAWGARRRRSSPARCWRRSTCAGAALLAALLAVALGAAALARARARRSASCGCSSPAADRVPARARARLRARRVRRQRRCTA